MNNKPITPLQLALVALLGLVALTLLIWVLLGAAELPTKL